MSIFNRYTLTKVCIIFFVGLFSRFLVNFCLDVNVFSEFGSYISLAYYIVFSYFIVAIQGIVDYLHLNIIPIFIIDLFSFLMNKIIYFYSSLKSLNIKNFYEIFNTFSNKAILNGTIENNSQKGFIISNNKNTNTILLHKEGKSTQGSSRESRLVSSNTNGSKSVRNNSIYIKPSVDSYKDCIRFVPGSMSSSSTSITRSIQSNTISPIKSNTVTTSVSDFIMDNNPLFGSSINSSYSTPKSMTPLFPVRSNESGVNGLNGVNNVFNEGSHYSYISRGTRPSFIPNSVVSTELNSQSKGNIIEGVSERVLEKRAIYNTNSVVNNRETLNTQDINSNIATANNNNSYTEFVDIEGRKNQIKENVLENIKQYNYKNRVGVDISHKETVIDKTKEYNTNTRNEEYDWYADKHLVKTKDGRRVFVSNKNKRLLYPTSRDFKSLFKGIGGKK